MLGNHRKNWFTCWQLTC
ncbi:Bgt-50485 [Blumeria graminis f. sp. tritici]|uniref:Bgt-50485 n=1 Tax=Blumeria graminis f. sp. tritici TaxID=62690 RepID=A0A9X9L843_BLUGR|nr:Bgt-50485 [Blumeria graminis f. sp. tritici]